MRNKIVNYIPLGFCFLWAFLIFTDYLYFHPSYFLSIKNFQYLEMTTVLALLGGLSGYIYLIIRPKIKIVNVLDNGLGILLVFFLIIGIVIPMHFIELGTNIDLSVYEVVLYISKILFVLLSTFYVYLVCFVVGDFFLTSMTNIHLKTLDRILVSIALGISAIILLLFVLAYFEILSSQLIWGLFILLPIVLWKRSIYFSKVAFINNIGGPKLGWLGFFSFFLTLLFIALIYLQNIRPVPFGFDALAIYLNLPKLVFENAGLIEGYSPYYWSLFISLGYFLTSQLEVVISLSVSGGILSIIALYAIARKWLSKDYSLLIILLFYSLPLVNFQSFRDVKNDLGLLFILLAIFLLFLNFQEYLVENKTLQSDKSEVLSKFKLFSIDAQYIIIIGLLSGIALGIKLTSLILLFSIVAMLFFIQTGIIGLLTSVLLSVFFILIAGLDVASGLRSYHFGVNWLRWLVLALGLIGSFFIILRKKSQVLVLLKWCILYAIFAFLTYLPWPIKNYSETKELSFQTFIEGKQKESPVRTIK